MKESVPTIQEACPYCARMQQLANQTALVADDFRRQLAQIQLFYEFLTTEIKQAPQSAEPFIMVRSRSA